jgi:hypothetical protein
MIQTGYAVVKTRSNINNQKINKNIADEHLAEELALEKLDKRMTCLCHNNKNLYKLKDMLRPIH